MESSISEIIVNEIRDSNTQEDVKHFLEMLVRLEAAHIDEQSWKYSESYRATIDEIMKKLGYDKE